MRAAGAPGTMAGVELSSVRLEVPDGTNLILAQSHFIKTVEDVHEALAGSSPVLRFGLGFCEASGPRLIRRSGNDEGLIDAAVRGAGAIGAGHALLVLLRDGFPVNVLNQLKAVPEICHVYCATANPVEVIVAVTAQGRGILGVVDGQPPLGVESDGDVDERRRLLRAIGYKL
jgi:adenosine/AMP kinase